MSTMLIKRRPFKVPFIFGNRNKSHMSGEYEGSGNVTVLFLAKNVRTSNEVWAGMNCFSINPDFFFRIASRKRR